MVSIDIELFESSSAKCLFKHFLTFTKKKNRLRVFSSVFGSLDMSAVDLCVRLECSEVFACLNLINSLK